MEDEIVATDQIEQDTELSESEASPVEEAMGDAEYTLEELGDVLIAELFGRLAEINGPLSEESDTKAAEAQTLRASHGQLQPRVEAQQRILSAEIDRAIAEGRDADAETKRQESAGLEQNLRDILAQAEACERRVQELEAEMQGNYRTVFESAYPEIRQSIVSAEIALVTLLDKVWGGIKRYETESGLPRPFVMTRHKSDMTPRERGPEAPYFTSLWRWFSGR